VLFLMRNPAYVRNFESVLRGLAARKHRVEVLFEGRKPADQAGFDHMARLASENETLSYDVLPPLPMRARDWLRMGMRATQDYLRYFEPPYEYGSRLRPRALAFLPDRVERRLASILRPFPRARRQLASLAQRGAERLGDDLAVRRELEGRQPRLLLVTPMLQFRSRQADWVRLAGELGIPTVACVYGWDHFTNKGLMHAQPDRVVVWNAAQETEAVGLHGVDRSSVVVTGAWPYDQWFRWTPSRSRDDFCRQLGVRADRALILYACSSRFIAERERDAVAEWLRAIRSSGDPRVAGATVIVRPHHLHPDEWTGAPPSDLPGIVVFPPNGADPVDEASRADYYDSIAHADAVVGINTSALVESAIADTPALAYPAPAFRSSQEELPHFQHLVGRDGFVQTSGSMAEHVSQFSSTLAGESDQSARQDFVKTFLRPLGDDPAPTEKLVGAIEELLAEAPPRKSTASKSGTRMAA
jgi:hypothetical protein